VEALNDQPTMTDGDSRTSDSKSPTTSKSRGQRKPAAPQTAKRCFIISPIGSANSPERIHADAVFQNILEPVLPTCGFVPFRADQESQPGNITGAIIETLRDAPLAIGVLTYLKPNVMYEVGIRHAWDLPLILMAERGTELPFDVHAHSTIFYSLGNDNEITKTRQQLRQQSASLNHDSDAHSLRSIIFRQAMASLGQSYSMDAVFIAKATTLTTFCEELRRVRDGMDKDFERGSVHAQPLEHFRNSVVDAFHELRTKTRVFESIAAAQHSAHRALRRCEPLLRRMTRLQQKGVQLQELLNKLPGTVRDFQEMKRLINGIIKQAGSLCRDCHAPPPRQSIS
jgi:hypothetical protein